MKKTIIYSAFLSIMMLVGYSASAQSRSDNYYIGHARGVLRSCIGQALGNGVSGNDIQTNVQRSICFVSGEFVSVEFYYIQYGPICHPTEENPCSPPLPVLHVLGVVQFGCDGNVVYSECFPQ
jgi:hypothetical protein